MPRIRTALWIATLIWVVGMATVFGLGNDALEAVSVFTFDRIAFLVVAALVAVLVAGDPALLRRGGRVEAVMAVYLGIVVVSWATTLAQKNAVDVKRDVNLLLQSFLMPYTAFVIARHVGWTRWQVATAYRLIIAAVGIFLIGVALIQGLVDWSFLVAETHQDIHRSRARGPFDNAVPFSVIVALLVPIAVVLHAHAPRRARQWLLLALCVGLIEALLLGRVRIVWVALPSAMLYLAAVFPALRRSAIVAAVGLLAAVVLSAAGVDLRWVAGPDGALRHGGGTIGRIAEADSIYNRVAVYGTAINMIAHRPLFGFGFGAHTFESWRGDYYASCCGVSPEWAVPCAVPHNEVFNVLILLGVVGLLVYLGLVRELWRAVSAHVSATDPLRASLAAGVQAGFIILAITAQMHDVMYLSAAQVLFFFLAGLAAAPAWRGATARDGT